MRNVLATLLGAAVLAAPARAATDHADLVKGPFATGPDVTKACLACHESQAADFMKTTHWTWSARQVLDGKPVDLGKVNAVNNFCIALQSNEPRCTSCHAGYGWKDATFDFKKAENVDCLVCHDTTGTYKKLPAGAGHPAYHETEFPPGSGKKWPAVDLEAVAKSVGAPSRASCGACHFYGGGGDHIKHGDLDSSLVKPSLDMDVHMAIEGANMACTACHRSQKHVIPGKALGVSLTSGGETLDCSTCHAGTPHGKNAVLNRHAATIACQTCHIPTFARTLPTKVWWDWSSAGQDRVPGKDQYGLPTYDKMKGDFRWAKDVRPTYVWFDGSVERVVLGEMIDPSRVVHLNHPKGKRGDGKSKLTPFKVMKGKQPYDAGNRAMVVPHLFGKGGYWQTYDWPSAVADGMKVAGVPYSGKMGWVETDMYWKVNHMVVPRQKALRCDDCHGDEGRLDWKALGYPGDPRKK
ncbi:MAG TPA: tetrathionate reductase family octaheme c-type cytochrome [Anaeromyxobacteraceae bacterium]|nr:tetrathionate reductase family octaheme c-type cytochrome [Anaeromyxobacteraceae bacterium]